MSAFFVSVGTPTSFNSFGDPAVPDAKAKFAEYKQRSIGLGPTREVAGIGDGAVLGTTGIASYKDGIYVEILRVLLTDEQLVELAKRSMDHV